MTDLSVIIVTYNPGAILAQCLASVVQSQANLEVVVVDNASTDGTPELIQQNFPQIHLIANQENKGFAGANNQGLAATNGQYRLLLNPDVIVDDQAFNQMITFMEANPQAGIVGPRTYDEHNNVAVTARAPFHPLNILWQYVGLDRVLPNHVYGVYRQACETATAPFEVGWVQGSCLMLRDAVYQKIGGLDEGFFLFCEEPDFCERAYQAGWKTYFLPNAHIQHLESSSVSRYPLRKLRNHHISPLHYFRKRHEWRAVITLKLGFTLELIVKSIVRLGLDLIHRQRPIYGRAKNYWIVLAEVWRY